MMENIFTDYRDGTFIPQVDIKRREDNGHYTASSCGLSATHWDQATAVHQLNTKIEEGILKGEIHPGS